MVVNKIVQYTDGKFIIDNGQAVSKNDIIGCPCVGCEIIDIGNGKFQSLRIDYDGPPKH